MKRNIAYLVHYTFNKDNWISNQDIEKDREDIFNLAKEKDLHVVELLQEKVHYKVSWRQRKIALILEELKEGDCILVNKVIHLGGSLCDSIDFMLTILQKGIHICLVERNLSLDNPIQNMDIVKDLASIFSSLKKNNSKHGDLISKRTRESLKSKKLAGVKLGRPKGPGKSKLDVHRTKIETLLSHGLKQKFIADSYNVSESNFSSWLKKNNIKRTTANQ